MKRVALILIAVLMIFSFVSCSCGEDDSGSEIRTESGGEWSKMY